MIWHLTFRVSRPHGISITVDTSEHGYVIVTEDGRLAHLTLIELDGDFTIGKRGLVPQRSLKYAGDQSVLGLISEAVFTGEQGPVIIIAHANADRSHYRVVVSCGDESAEIHLDGSGSIIGEQSPSASSPS